MKNLMVFMLILFFATGCGESTSNAPREEEFLAVSDYEYCGDEEVCEVETGRRNGKTYVTCNNADACKDQEDCSCTFWKRNKIQDDDDQLPPWEKIDERQVEKDNSKVYACWCMKEK